MLDKPDNSPLRPSFEQLLGQGIIREHEITEMAIDDSRQDPLEKFYTVNLKLCPPLPKEEDWISLQGLTPDDITSFNELFQAAQKDGIVFVKYNSGSIEATDTRSIDGYAVGWGWMNIDGLNLSVEDRAKCTWDGSPPSGSLNKIPKNSSYKTIEDVLLRNNRIPLVRIGNAYLNPGEVEPIVTTHIAFDMDTTFDLKDAYEKVRNNMQKRAITLMDGILKNPPN